MWTNTIGNSHSFSDDLNKKIIRVKSDHGNNGIRLDKGQKLQNGSAFFIDDHHV